MTIQHRHIPTAAGRSNGNENANVSLPSIGDGMHKESFFARIAGLATCWSGSSYAFASAIFVVLLWVAMGPVFHYSDTWQLVINTGTTIVTFLMVFLIQRAQNKDSRAMHVKLNELVAAVKGASNQLVNAESLTEAELKALHTYYCELVGSDRGECISEDSAAKQDSSRLKGSSSPENS